jgi:3D-(3,5/4)-trihydroxycyclohexane-1,2-dione acylhydrolase (decyclizing)
VIAQRLAGAPISWGVCEVSGWGYQIHVETDPMLFTPDSDAWWDVPVAQVSGLESARDARVAYESARKSQRRYL